MYGPTLRLLENGECTAAVDPDPRALARARKQGHGGLENLGDHAGAVESYHKALAGFDAMAAENPADQKARGGALEYAHSAAEINRGLGSSVLRELFPSASAPSWLVTENYVLPCTSFNSPRHQELVGV